MTLGRLDAPIILLSVIARVTLAQDTTHQRPSAEEQFGTVHFSTSCRPATAPQFDRAISLLHSFEFGESIRAFTAVIAADSNCAMAYWGIALSSWSNPMAAGARTSAQLASGRAATDAAARLSARASNRERRYIAAVGRLYTDYDQVGQGARIRAYEHAMHDLMLRQPTDTEAKIFYALALAASASPNDKTFIKQRQAGAILESLWVKQPNHPGLAHYIIHAYDVPSLAARAEAAARRYAMIAPSAAHALHMPSHTYTRVGQWSESIATNRRSMDAALRSGAIAEALHAADYAVYAYLQLARDSAAKALLDSLPSLAARFDGNAITGAAPGSAGIFAIAAIPARYALERRDWTAAAALEPKASDVPWAEAMTYFVRSLGASHTADTTRARIALDSLAGIRARLIVTGERYWAEQVAIEMLGARAWLDVAERRPNDALTRMREAAVREDATDKNAVTPGPLAPARELLGDMLMMFDRPVEALVEYRATLKTEPNRFRALLGAWRAAAKAGDRDRASQYHGQLRKLCREADVPGRRELQDVRDEHQN